MGYGATEGDDLEEKFGGDIRLEKMIRSHLGTGILATIWHWFGNSTSHQS